MSSAALNEYREWDCLIRKSENKVKNEKKPMGIAEFIEREEKDIEMKGGMEKQ